MLTRRQVLGAAGGALAIAAAPASARGLSFPQVDKQLMARARAAAASKRPFITDPRAMMIVDFSQPSSAERFHLVDAESGWVTSYYVAHGRGSDPGHSVYLHRFSNDPGSEASSAGAYVTRDVYHGKNGRSIRLEGLDHSNSNAEARNIVLHAAGYAEPEMLIRFGKLGRSEGCFAVPKSALEVLLSQLGPGCLLYCDKI
jgi:hypothetical protein